MRRVGYFDAVAWQDALVCSECGAVVHPMGVVAHGEWHAGPADGPPAPTPRPELDAATALWHEVMAALDHTGLQAQHVQIYPGRPRGDGDGFRDPELNVYLRSEDPEDLRRFAAHLGIDADMEEREEVKEERAGLARITYWSIEEKDDDQFTYRRAWASRRVIEPKGD